MNIASAADTQPTLDASDGPEPEDPRLRGSRLPEAIQTAPVVVLDNSPSVSSETSNFDQTDEVTGRATEQKLEYALMHCVPGRVRIKITNRRRHFQQASAHLLGLISLTGVKSVRINSWCLTAVIDYDWTHLAESELFQCLDNLSLTGEVVAIQPPLNSYSEPAPIKWLRSGLHLLDILFTPTVQLAIGLTSFVAGIAGFAGVPIFITRILVLVSAAPIAVRATRTMLDSKKLGIDALDGMAASLMIANGKFIEAGFMTALIALGEFIRERTARRCEKIVSDLLGLSSRSAWLIQGKKRLCVTAAEVQPGQMVVVYPGEMVPVDGEIVSGQAAIDQSKLTGEAIPVEVKIGDTVFASTVAVEGKIYVRCTASGSNTRAGLVLQCVSQAPLHETNIQNHASGLADRLVVPIFLAAGVCFFITRDVTRLMSMLILDFCTGLRIAAPTAVLSSMHRAGQRGILIKSGVALEKLSKVTAVVFDKTGTLTSGEPVVEEVTRFNGHTEDEILALAASVEMRLHHPAARAIVKAAQKKGLTILDRTDSEFTRSMGAKAMVGTQTVTVGSRNLMLKEGIVIDEARDSEMQATSLGESISYVAIDGKVAGLIRYKDKLRPEVVAAIADLRKLGVKKLVMATGDTQEAAERIAAVCGLKEVVARAFPEDKAKLVQELKAAGHNVAVIGDGINDSPALAYADVAISLHGATDAAQHGADVVLTDDNLQKLPEAIRIARSSMSLVKENLAMAIVPNGTGFVLAGLGMLGPAGATILNNGAAIAAALNSLRPIYMKAWSTEPVQIEVAPSP